MTTKFFKSLYRLPSSMLALSTMIYSATGIAASPVNLSEQRDLYDQAQQLLDNKQVDKYLALRPKIASYPLTPYVDYRTLLVQLNEKSPQQVSQFIEQHKGLPFSTRIRAPYIDHLAREQQWQSLLDFQTELPRGEKSNVTTITPNIRSVILSWHTKGRRFMATWQQYFRCL